MEAKLWKYDILGYTIRKARNGLAFSDRQDLAIGFFVCFLSYFVSLHYTGGDQIGYAEVYRAIRGVDPVLAFKIYGRFISTVEFVHFILIYVASNLVIDKNLFFALINGLLAIIFFRSIRAIGINVYLATSFVFTNYYFYVCYFAAERLKVALIFFLVATFSFSKLKRYFWYMVAIMSHVTVIILLMRCLLDKFLMWFERDSVITKKYLIEIGFLFVLLAVGVYFLGGYALWKMPQYYERADNGLNAAVPILIYITASLYYAPKKSEVFVDFFFIVVAFCFFGGSRINMFAYFMFLKYGLQYNNGLNFAVASTSLYFAYKGLLFLQAVFENGQAF